MIAFASMLQSAAEQAGISVPKDLESWDSDANRNNYPHFFCFCALQLGKPVRYHGEHWYNAKIIAEIKDSDIRTMRLDDFIRAGFSY